MSEGDMYAESDHILAPDRMTRVSGSVPIDRDLFRDRKALDPTGDLEARRVAYREESPAAEVERDADGVPYRLCSGGHYRPIRAFHKNAARPDGLDNYCKECRHAMYERAKFSAVPGVARR